jgi:hypothetical protein
MRMPFTPFDGFLTDSMSTSSCGGLHDMPTAFENLARGLAHPAALLGAGMVSLALNRPYARMLRLPPAALVGKEYSRAHGDRQDSLTVLESLGKGEPCGTALPAPVVSPDGRVYRARRATPLRNVEDQALGMVLEYCLEPAAGRTAY